MSNKAFITTMRGIVSKRYIRTGVAETERFRTGFRSGGGDAEAVVMPGTLLEQWKVLQACINESRIVIMQAANTGLTEGSTPKGRYDRPVVIINTLRLDKIHILKNGKQIVSHPGGTLHKLEKLLQPLGRIPHSEIGSSCIGASIIGGICNNSGGALVQRGPAYTELSLFAHLNADGQLELINHLGINLGDTPEEILLRLDQGLFTDEDIIEDIGRGSDGGYPAKVRDIDAPTPARYNADPEYLFESSGCAGKLGVFAVRLNTHSIETGARVYYIGTNDPVDLTNFRRRVLSECKDLPISGEYLHRDIFDIAKRYGKDTLLMIHWLGTDYLPGFFSLKGYLDARLNKLPLLPKNFIDRAMQTLSHFLPEILPKRILKFRDDFEHHLILKVGANMTAEVEAKLSDIFGDDRWFHCSQAEAGKAMLQRFAAAGAAVRYHAVHADEVEDIIALDIALRRNDRDWLEVLPVKIEKELLAKLYYGHFFCHVFHQDYIVRKGANTALIKEKMLELLRERGAEYPAEHNVGHLYEAKPALADFYEKLDPTNSFNPGIGKTSKQRKHPVSDPMRHGPNSVG
ncbi:MAG: D-lactate dehydrogenase [Arenicellales bacterium]|jgi:D-lactate dehydrogenase|nr:D-lactate dehydrogenase [Arenicellales bacterium]